MRTVFKRILVNVLCFWLISQLIGAIDFGGNTMVLFIASMVLSIMNWLVKPILNIILLPINIITLGAFRWVINIIVLYLVTIVIPEFQIHSFIFPGAVIGKITLPVISFNLFSSYLVVAFLLSLISDIIYALFE